MDHSQKMVFWFACCRVTCFWVRRCIFIAAFYFCRNIRSNTSFAPWCSFCLWMTRKSEPASSRRNPMKKQMPEEPGGTFGGYISGINSEYNNMVGLPIAVSDMKAEDWIFWEKACGMNRLKDCSEQKWIVFFWGNWTVHNTIRQYIRVSVCTCRLPSKTANRATLTGRSGP